MGKPYSDDLRERVIAAIEAGHTREEVAELFNMALSTVGGGCAMMVSPPRLCSMARWMDPTS